MSEKTDGVCYAPTGRVQRRTDITTLMMRWLKVKWTEQNINAEDFLGRRVGWGGFVLVNKFCWLMSKQIIDLHAHTS